MIEDKVEISLIGAKTLGTLTTVFQQGTPTLVTLAVWESLKSERNPSTGETLFCLTSELPAPVAADTYAADMRASGLDELDTGNVVNTLDILKEDGQTLTDTDGEPLPKGSTGEALGEQSVAAILADAAASTPDAVADAAAPAAQAKRLVIGGNKTKPVQV